MKSACDSLYDSAASRLQRVLNSSCNCLEVLKSWTLFS